MRKLIFKIEMTLDGFISGPQKGKMDWSESNIHSKDQWNDVFGLLDMVDTVIMSPIIYKGFKAYWPAEATNPSSSDNNKKFSKWLNTVPKIVFSRTLKKVDWENARLVKGDLRKEMAGLKKLPGKNMVMWGGSEFPRALMKLGLIDEYRINIHPAVIGKGKSLFDKAKTLKLKLVHSKIFDSGVVSLRYQND